MTRLAALLLAVALGCTTQRVSPRAAGPGTVLHAPELARVRCLLVAPFENGSDAPLAAQAATAALLGGVDAARTRVFPVAELRSVFRDTPLELPQGISPSLALELAELVGADAALWGSVEGRVRDGGELLVTIRLSLADDHRLLFAENALVSIAPGERADAVIRRAVLDVARPMLARLGDPGRKRCFAPERTRALRRFAGAQAAPASAASPAAPAPRVAAPRATAPAAPARTPRQDEWAQRLSRGERILLEDVEFAGRRARLARDAGLADLAAVLLASPVAKIRLEAFVDATSDHAADARLSASMAEVAGKRLVALGVAQGRVSWAGRGGESPILPNFTVRGRAANRRVEAVAFP